MAECLSTCCQRFLSRTCGKANFIVHCFMTQSVNCVLTSCICSMWSSWFVCLVVPLLCAVETLYILLYQLSVVVLYPLSSAFNYTLYFLLLLKTFILNAVCLLHPEIIRSLLYVRSACTLFWLPIQHSCSFCCRTIIQLFLFVFYV
jgi:hypothetical protein